MKKLLLTFPLLSIALIGSAQAFKNGDKIVELGIGVGAAQVENSQYIIENLNQYSISSKDQTKATFTQHIGMEFGVYDINDNSSIGVGFTINNSYGAKHNQIVTGTYNYNYLITTFTPGERNSWWPTGTETIERSGTGTSQAHVDIEDVNVMAKVAYHYTFIDKLDTYVALGFGVSSYRRLYSGFKYETGFSKDSHLLDRTSSEPVQLEYKYNDLDHVKWEGGDAKGRFVLGAYVGARYWISDSWGVHLNLGLTSLSFKKNNNNFNILEIGASYSF